MKKVMETLDRLNETMREFGFAPELCLKNDYIKITGKEVIMKIPFSLTLKIPKKDFEGQSDNAISDAVSRAINRAVSLNK